METKTYHYETFDYMYDALEEMNKHQDWNIISVYPTGWRSEVCCLL